MTKHDLCAGRLPPVVVRARASTFGPPMAANKIENRDYITPRERLSEIIPGSGYQSNLDQRPGG